LGVLLSDRRGVDRSAKLEALSADLRNRESLVLRDGWVPLVPEGWDWDEVRQAWAAQAVCRGDGALAELVRWADAPELAARIRRATAVIDPDRLATFASRSASPPVRQLLNNLGMVQEVV
jgi:hypothetical protein